MQTKQQHSSRTRRHTTITQNPTVAVKGVVAAAGAKNCFNVVIVVVVDDVESIEIVLDVMLLDVRLMDVMVTDVMVLDGVGKLVGCAVGSADG